MFIVDMTVYESDFVTKSTKKSKALKVRTFDIDHECSLFAYHYEEYVHLKLRRYNDKETTMREWDRLKAFGILFPDINLNEASDVYLDVKDNQLHIHIPCPAYKRHDS